MRFMAFRVRSRVCNVGLGVKDFASVNLRFGPRAWV